MSSRHQFSSWIKIGRSSLGKYRSTSIIKVVIVALADFTSKPEGAKQLAAQPTGELAGHLRPS